MATCSSAQLSSWGKWFSLHQLWTSLVSSPVVSRYPSLHCWAQLNSIFFMTSLQPWERLPKSSPPQTEGGLFTLSTHRAHIPAPGHPGGPPLDLLQFIHAFLVIKGLRPEAILQRGSNEHQVRTDNHFPPSNAYMAANTAGNAVGILCCHTTLLHHVQSAVHQDSQVLLHRAAPPPFRPQLVL